MTGDCVSGVAPGMPGSSADPPDATWVLDFAARGYTTSVSGTVESAVQERLEGGSPGRIKAFLAAVAIGFAAFIVAYRLLRND